MIWSGWMAPHQQETVERRLGSPIDPDARIAKLKDGRTHPAYKPEHTLDLDTGAIIAAELHAADQGGTPDRRGSALARR
jgi:hypothetical protein